MVTFQIHFKLLKCKLKWFAASKDMFRAVWEVLVTAKLKTVGWVMEEEFHKCEISFLVASLKFGFQLLLATNGSQTALR